MAVSAQFEPAPDDPLRNATPEVDDVEARRAKAAIENRLFSGPAKRVKVGRYRVDHKIGAGGMGVVYRAHDPELARDVALKLMNTTSFSDEDEANRARGRLVREARAMAKLAHPNVIHVYDVGAVDDGVFIAMELVDGDPLSKWVERETPSWRDTLRCYLDAGEGLAAAHEAGIVHRDFKPENVLLGSDGRVRVGDFGLAGGPGSETGRHDLPAGDSGKASVDDATVSTSLTRTGALLGTPKYMAPEQESGLSATARSDQFGFCVALYEGLYGHPPFEGDTVATYRQAVASETVRVPDNTDVPKWVFELLRRGLRRDPADRHPSMRALLDALRTRLAALTDPRPRKRRAVWLLALGAGIGVAVSTAMAMRAQPSASDAPPSTTLAVAATSGAQPTDGSAAQVDPAAGARTSETAPKGSEIAPSEARNGEETADSNSTAARVEPETPKVEPPEPAVNAAAKGPRKRGVACFYKEDKRSFIREGRKKASTIEHLGTCYTCRKAGAHVVTTLSPPPGKICRTSHLCRATQTDECAP
ncbi:MAG: protein kinase domain-containing protein [Nannocystaceae bacterium]|nr:protein kinase [bacterium]